MKAAVYSWRVSPEIKSELERHARMRKVPVSAVLDAAVRDWLHKSASEGVEDEEQRRLHEAASKCFGVLEGHNPGRAEHVRRQVRERLRRRHER